MTFSVAKINCPDMKTINVPEVRTRSSFGQEGRTLIATSGFYSDRPCRFLLAIDDVAEKCGGWLKGENGEFPGSYMRSLAKDIIRMAAEGKKHGATHIIGAFTA